eukprot:6210344-Pleurochrysis_carterae.AAC.2
MAPTRAGSIVLSRLFGGIIDGLRVCGHRQRLTKGQNRIAAEQRPSDLPDFELACEVRRSGRAGPATALPSAT